MKPASTAPLIGITIGDPNGIGPEITLKALLTPAGRRHRTVVIGSPRVLEFTRRRCRLSIAVCPIERIEDLTGRRIRTPTPEICVLDPAPEIRIVPRPGERSVDGGRAALAAVKAAARLALDGKIDAIATAPLDKAAIKRAGSPFPGHTELLAKLSGAESVGMLFAAGPPPSGPSAKKPLCILLTTIHEAVASVPRLITATRVETAIRLAHDAGRRLLGFRRPRIGVAALNPHAGEDGLFGLQERDAIAPAVAAAIRAGISASGPFPADTLIARAYRGEFDLVVAMYHDQALIPVKLLAFGRAVNITVGLPFVRTSVDHGTAFDIAGKGIADPSSLLSAIAWADALVRRSARYAGRGGSKGRSR